MSWQSDGEVSGECFYRFNIDRVYYCIEISKRKAIVPNIMGQNPINIIIEVYPNTLAHARDII